MKIIGIAGGSGSGKSTLAYQLVDRNPKKYESINLDDYQKLKTDPDLPMLNGIINWDHPDVIRWNRLLADLTNLQNGNPIEFESWAHRSNPDYVTHREMLRRVIEHHPVIIVEGYLSLHLPQLNEMYDLKIFLDLNEKTRNARRDKAEIIGENDYENLILKPMFHEFVEPTKAVADLIIDVGSYTPEDLYQLVEAEIKKLD